MPADRGRCRFWRCRGVARWSCEYIEVATRAANYIPEGTMTPVQRRVKIATRVGRSIYVRFVIRKEMLRALAEKEKSAVSLPWGMVACGGRLMPYTRRVQPCAQPVRPRGRNVGKEAYRRWLRCSMGILHSERRDAVVCRGSRGSDRIYVE